MAVDAHKVSGKSSALKCARKVVEPTIRDVKSAKTGGSMSSMMTPLAAEGRGSSGPSGRAGSVFDKKLSSAVKSR